MKYRIIGLKPYSNDFKGVMYCGVSFHCLNLDFPDFKDALGSGVKSFSAKQSVVDDFAKGRTFQELIDLNCEFYYDGNSEKPKVVKILEV